MAISKITYKNKTGIQNDASVLRENKVVDDDMNEIKQVVNNNADELNTAQSNIENLQSGQGTANTDITNLKSRVSTLETDNTTNKSNIQQLQSKQQETETNIETLQEKVTTLETDNTQNKSDINALKTDNETNKSNISTLQEEQLNQNTNIENLQNENTKQNTEISQIKGAIINVETEQAKSLHISDGSPVPGQLSVEGNAEQETQEGTDNLAILEEGSTTKSGVTVSIENGNITANGQNETEGTLTFVVGKVYLVEGEKYYIKRLGSAAGTGIYVNNNGNQAWGTNEESFFTARGTGNYDIRLTFGANAVNNTTQQILISKTSGAEWVEGKVQIPSQINPSKVKCLGSNKNEFDITNIENGGYTSGVVGAELSKNSNNTRVRLNNLISAKKNTQYSFSIKTDKALRYNILEIGEDNIIKKVTSVTDTRSTTIITTEETAYITFLFLWQTTTQNITTDDLEDCLIKLEKGDKATSYSPYGQGSTNIKKYNKNLYKPVVSSGSTNGISYTVDNNGAVTLNGQATANADIYIIKSDFNNQITDIELKTITTQVANSELSLYVSLGDGTYARNTFTIQEEQYISASFIRVPSGTTCNNLTVYPQIEEGSVATDYEKHQQENDVLPIQQEMLNGDYFELEEDGWKEVHFWIDKIFDGTEKFANSLDNCIYVQNEVENVDFTCEKHYCNYYKYIEDETSLRQGSENGFTFASFLNRVWFNNKNTELQLESNFKTWLQQKYSEGNPLFLKYRTTVAIKLACTEEQSAVLDKLNNLDLFKNTNNIITAEDIALLKLKYVADTKTYIDNQINEKLANINQQILELAGGN